MERFLDPEEQSRILARAAELQARHQESRPESAAGMSLHDLARAAEEAGIDPRFVHEAAQEGPPMSEESRQRIWSVSLFFGFAQVLTWAALANGAPLFAFPLAIPATAILAAFAARDRRSAVLSLALLTGCTFGTASITSLICRFVPLNPHIVSDFEQSFSRLFFIFAAQVLLFGLFFLVATVFRTFRTVRRTVLRT